MARAKKEKLSLEELLEKALVKEEDQPYQVPSNWVWTTLDNVALYKKGPFGSAITKAMFVPKGEKTYKVYEQGNAIRKDKTYGSYYITEEKYQELKGFTVSPDDLIVSCAGTVGEIYQLPQEIEAGIINQALMRIKVNSKINLGLYLLYFGESLKTDITGKSKGTAIKNIPPFAVLKQMPFPLPPISEQQRIVERVESLFDKLDTAKELVENALDSFENRKAAILHKAFTGELTAKWREENGVSLDSWEESTFGKFVDTKYGYTESASVEEVGPKFLRITDIQDGSVNWGSVPYCTISDSEFEKYRLKVDDIVVARTGATTGKSYIITEDVKAVFASYLIRINITNEDRILPKYLWSFMQSTLYWNQIMEVKKGIAQPGVNANKLKELLIDIPSIEEQNEIIRIVEGVLDKECRAQELYDVVDKIDLMKKSILARAFRGELGTNNPDEESAENLLREILEKKLS